MASTSISVPAFAVGAVFGGPTTVAEPFVKLAIAVVLKIKSAMVRFVTPSAKATNSKLIIEPTPNTDEVPA